MGDSNPLLSGDLSSESRPVKKTLKGTIGSEPFQLPPEFYSAWVNAPNPDTYISFGDDGVTATVNAYGHLMHFGRYTGVGSSGFFSADQDNTDPAYFVVARADQLLELCSERGSFDYGLTLNHNFDGRPCLTYVHDRWPRFEHQPPAGENTGLNLTTQWVIHQGTVLQQLVVTNLSGEPKEVEFTYRDEMAIRDLDHLEYREEFQEATSGPDDYSRVHGTQGISSNKQEKGGLVATVVSVYINGEATKLSPMVENRKTWELTIQAKNSVELVVAYKMILLPEQRPDKKNFLVEAEAADVNKILADAPRSFTRRPLPGLGLSTPTNIPDGILGRENKAEKGVGGAAKYGATLSGPEGSAPLADSSRHLDFVVRRHLEHILSVCAIPTRTPALSSNDMANNDMANAGESGAITPVALTCGDISGHRICTSASYFAFQFLVDMYKRLSVIRLEPEATTLRKRIYAVCRGHIEWLRLAWESPMEPDEPGSPTSRPRHDAAPGCFKANYWVTGKAMGTSEDTWTPDDALTDTAFQLIKMTEFARLIEYDLKTDDELKRDDLKEDLKRVRDLMGRSGPWWLRALVRLDQRDAKVWPHKPGEDIADFRLDDQVWIWKAIEAMQDQSVWQSGLRNDSTLGECEPDQHESQRVDRLRLSHSDLPRIILRNFTTENDSSGKRMLAVTRSARESRFLLHARDTALFYGIGWGLPLEEPSGASLDVWENTLEAQVHHDENQETNWDNAIRYALAVEMGSRGRRINKRPPAELVKSALKVLLASTSANGFFPGLLDKNTKKPQLFQEEEHRDFYFHASFEIPFVLFRNAAKINDLHKELASAVGLEEGTKETEKGKGLEKKEERGGRPSESPKADERESPHDNEQEIQDRITREPKKHPWVETDLVARLLEHLLPVATNTVRPGLKTAVMKKIIPFNSLLDSTNVVALDEEWLYPYPSFLQRDETLVLSQVAKADQHATSRGDSRGLRSSDGSDGSDDDNGVVRVALSHLLGKTKEGDEINLSDEPNISIWAVDAPKRKKQGKRGVPSEFPSRAAVFDNNHKLWDWLKRPRLAERAKKRFIWLNSADANAALACYLASTDDEKGAVSDFFDRHQRYDKFFSDHTNRVRNTWESEFHISFYQLVDRPVSSRGIPKPYEDEVPTRPARTLARASIGFRFLGDFFDRHWTCHFVQFVPRWADDKHNPLAKPMSGESNPYLGYASPNADQRRWWQRKVLELILLDAMLAEAVRSTREILDAVPSGLLGRGGDPPATQTGHRTAIFSSEQTAIYNSDDYFASKRQWLRLQDMLQLVEDELELVFTTLAKWETREKDRGHERPRWTQKDESRYREHIRRLVESTSRRIRDLQTSRARIVSQKERLAASLNTLRDDLAFMGADNIGLFTYVTIFFLPLGFAVSIFSMNGSPNSDLVATMVIVAAVALAATIVALFNTRKLVHRFIKASRRLNERSGSAMQKTALYLYFYQNGDTVAASNAPPIDSPEKAGADGIPIPDDHRMFVSGDTPSSSWHISFWIVYLLIELPARRVLLARYAMKTDHGLGWMVAIWRVGTGLVLLPVFVLSWVLRMLAFTAAAVLGLLWGYLVSLFSHPRPEPDKRFADHLQKLTLRPNHRDLMSLATAVTQSVQSWRTKKTGTDNGKMKNEGGDVSPPAESPNIPSDSIV